MPLKTKKEKEKTDKIDGAGRLMPGQDRSQSWFYSDTFRSLDSQGAALDGKQWSAIDLFSIYLKQALDFV